MFYFLVFEVPKSDFKNKLNYCFQKHKTDWSFVNYQIFPQVWLVLASNYLITGYYKKISNCEQYKFTLKCTKGFS